MKARVLSDRDPKKLAEQIEAFAAGELTVEHLGYTLDAKGVHHALVLYVVGRRRESDLEQLASRFIERALGTPDEKSP